MALDPNDLDGRIEPLVHFDEYKPKMGKDDAIIVATFKVLGKAPAQDLEHFIERGYEWVVDAETSAGETSDGKYLVSIEAERRSTYPEKFMSMIGDLNNLTDVEDWQMVYYERSDKKKNPVQSLTVDTVANSIPLSPKKYRDSRTAINAIESILNTARVPRSKGDLNEFRTFTRTARD